MASTTTTTTTHFPDDFKCPISLDIMTDPVILTSGHTFDRRSIQRWLDDGHRTCPISKLPLPEHPYLIPNHTLRSLISNFTLASSLDSQSTQQQPHPTLLISSLTSRSSSLQTKLDSLSQLNRLSKRDSAIRRCLTESGAVSAVLRCVNSPDSAIKEKSLSLLLNLSLDDDNKVGLVAEGAIKRVVTALRTGSSDCRAIASTLLTSLAVLEVNKATIGAYPDAIRNLVMIIRYGEGREVKEAATALYTICSFPENRRRAVEHGAVSVLFRVAESGLDRAVEVLGILAKLKEGREEIGKVDGCVKIFVKVLNNGSSRGIQHAMLTLAFLCAHSEAMCVEARTEGVLEICAGFVEDENEKIKTIASNLMKILSGTD